MDEIRSLLKTIRGVGPNKPVTQLQLSEIIRALHRERMNLYDEYYTGGVKPIATGKNSVAIGEGAKSTSYREMLVGSFPEELTATPDEWVATDRLFGIGNGIDADNRHDAFRVYKSGYAQLNNSLRLGAYSWGANNPEAGALQYTAGGSFALYRNTTWNRLAFIDPFATNNQFSYYDSLTETLKTRAIAIADVTGLQTALDGKAPASGSANYVQVSPANAQSGNIWMNGSIKTESGFTANLSINDQIAFVASTSVQSKLFSWIDNSFDNRAVMVTDSRLGSSGNRVEFNWQLGNFSGSTGETGWIGQIALEKNSVGAYVNPTHFKGWKYSYFHPGDGVYKDALIINSDGSIDTKKYKLSGVDLFGSLTGGYLPIWSGTRFLNSQFSHSSGGDYMILDNQYAGMLFKKSGVNKFIFGDDAFLSATRPNAYGFFLYGDNVIDFWANSTRIASFGQSSGIQFPSLAGTGTRLVTSQSDGTLANISNATGYLANDGSGNMSFGAITGFLPITGGELTGGLIGTTANFSGAATAASFVLGSTGWSIEVVSDKFTIKRNGVALKTLDASGNNKVLGESYRGGL